jgi:hypothetical protein
MRREIKEDSEYDIIIQFQFQNIIRTAATKTVNE